MSKLHFSIQINASKEKVWKTMLEDKTYREWTSEFNPTGSYYEGEWSQGSDMKFLGPDKDGTVSGMISRIKEYKPYDFVSIEHLGEIIKGEEKRYDSTEGIFENYTLVEKDGGTELLIDLSGLPEEYGDMFNGMWPKALNKLKEMSEK